MNVKNDKMALKHLYCCFIVFCIFVTKVALVIPEMSTSNSLLLFYL